MEKLGASLRASYEAERPHLGALPTFLPEPFDLVQRRRVGLDATVRFEGRTYSAPFAYAQREVEVRGCARVVQLWADGKVALLVIDEMGFEVMTRAEASLFFRLVSYRYGRGAIAITTNKGIADSPEMLAGDEVLATAILDRLLHRSHVLNISGRRYRLRELERVAASPRAGT